MDVSRKRPRPTLSCRECRQKKLRCDRNQPCQPCVKGQREALCVFDPGLHSPQPTHRSPAQSESQMTQPRTSNAKQLEPLLQRNPASLAHDGIIRDLQARVASLEAVVQADRTLSDEPHSHAQQANGTLSVKGDSCRYYGHGYRCGLFERVQKMATSLFQPSAHPNLWSLAKEVQSLSKRIAISRTPPPISGKDALIRLRDGLPRKEVCDSLLETYFSLYQERLAILHKPTFMSFYSNFMNEPGNSSTSNRVEAHLYAAMGLAAYHLQSSDHPHRETANQWLQLHPFTAVEASLDALPRRSRAEVSALQTRALIVLSQQARGLHIQEYWQATNALVRSAMTLGLHRISDQFHKFPPIQTDFRLRLWWSIIELDLRASLSYGMPAAICPEDTDCIPTTFPDASFLNSYLAGSFMIDSSFLIQTSLAQSLFNRLALANLTSRPLDPLNEAKLRHLWAQTEASMKNWPRLTASIAKTETGPKSVLASMNALQNTLQISVQRSFLSSATISVGCLRAAAALLSSLRLLMPEGEDDRESESCLNLFIVEFMHDIYKAIALISMHLDVGGTETAIGDQSLSSDSLFRLLEASLQVFIERAAYEYSNLKDILSVSISISLAKARSKGEEERKVVREGLMETFTSLRKVLSEATKVFIASLSPTMNIYSLQSTDTLLSSDTAADVCFDEFSLSESAFDMNTAESWPSSDWLFDIDENWL